MVSVNAFEIGIEAQRQFAEEHQEMRDEYFDGVWQAAYDAVLARESHHVECPTCGEHIITVSDDDVFDQLFDDRDFRARLWDLAEMGADRMARNLASDRLRVRVRGAACDVANRADAAALNHRCLK